MPLDHRHIYNDLEPLFLQRDGWRRIYPDLPGMGKTRAADWITHQDQMLEIVLEFIDQVTGGERFTVVGASYGGHLAQGAVYRRGAFMDGLFIYVPAFYTDRAKSQLPEHKVLKEEPEFLLALSPDEQELRDFIVVQSMELLDTFRYFISPAEEDADKDFLNRLRKNRQFSFDINLLQEPFKAPALILTGRYDNWCGFHEAFQILDNYPRATYAVLDQAGHALAIEQKDLFRVLVNDWLNRVEDYKSQVF
jgi:pimeloyl-ACP methyl ester carboxylesterase